MRLSQHYFKKIAKIIMGEQLDDNNGAISPYLSWSEIVDLFADCGFTDSVGINPSRTQVALEGLAKINGTENLKNLFEKVFRPNDFKSANKDIEKAVKLVNEIICYDKYELNFDGNTYKVFDIIEEEEKELKEVTEEVYCEKIQPVIIKHLDSAQFSIWVAVAWFTDKVLFQKLKEKRDQGVVISLIIDDNEVNTNSNLKHETVFHTIKVTPESSPNNLMHHKFFIIDLKTVVTGSYNWTKAAAYNNENILSTNRTKIVEKYAQEFIKLRKEYKKNIKQQVNFLLEKSITYMSLVIIS
ncbi:MAG: hypothetical protein FD167_1090 [bacterium]|nr:MAG: hypothetical protein FD167_1090 [bacterium]